MTWLFNIKYTFVPVNPNLLIGMFGAVLLIADYNSINGLSRKMLFWILMIIPIGLSIIPSKLFNPVFGFFYVYESVLVPIIQSCAIYLFYRLFKKIYKQPEFIHFVNLWISVVLIQSFLTLLINLVPEFKNLLFLVVKYTEGEAIVKASLDRSFRFIGFGTQFFGSAIIFATTLVLMFYKLAITEVRKIRLVLEIIFVFLVGILLARTSMVGLFIGLILYIHKKYLLHYSTLKTFIFKGFPLLILMLSIFTFGIFYFLEHSDIKDTPLYFAFELFINFENGKGLSTGSTNRMLEMYQVVPDNVITWIFGDGLLRRNDGGYYKYIDIGFLRTIFAVGIVGLLVNIGTHFGLAYSGFKVSKEHKWLFMYLLLLYVVLLSKGMLTFIPYIIYFSVALFLTNYNRQNNVYLHKRI